MVLRCAQELNQDICKLKLFADFRRDEVAKRVTKRAQSILAADSGFFSATSPHQRVSGSELHERVARVLVEDMLERREGAILTMTQAYNLFCRLTQQRSLNPIKRSTFRALMKDLVKDAYGMSLRNDVPDSENRHQQAWKGLAVVEIETLAA